MKLLALISLLFSSLSFAGQLTSVKQSAYLQQLFEEIDVAVEASGAFRVSEEFYFPGDLKKDCRIVGPKTVLGELAELAELTDNTGGDQDLALADLEKIVANKKYYECQWTGNVPYYVVNFTGFIATDFSYRILFELAYED